MDNTALVGDVDEQPQSSSSRWYRKPDGPHRMADIPAQNQEPHSVALTEEDDDDHVRDVDGENSPTPHSAWYRKPRPERDSSLIEPDPELAEQADEKTKRICGCSRPTFIIVLFFVVVVVAAAIGGGVAGAQASRNKGDDTQTTAS
ncbi:hypothetical protein KVR01_007835 [Diaporthe batatas]|uniref:uncharacterized protein n=1 Tax=Diaporthe batatas TaxID=748121 RepID=UPI001D038DBD|nr:uncharacterized protein KVR01_007835 [Diaporthe batatas]KAG8162070.1 hypothetical protein KVR01_007835 [Diaporthe batatas]